MDCCRSSRRLGGEDVKVVVRSGFEEMKASPWEKEDAMHEGIPILNYPRAQGVHRTTTARLTGVVFEKVSRAVRRARPPATGAHRRARRAHGMRRRAGGDRAGERVSLDRARPRHRVRPVRHAGGGQGHHAVDVCPTCSSAAMPRSGRRTSSGRWRTATMPPSPSTSCATARTCASARARMVNLLSQKMGIHEWSYDNDDLQRPALQGADQGEQDHLKDIKVEVELGFDPQARLRRGAALPQLRRADGVHGQAVHRVRCLRGHLPDGLHQLHRQRRGAGR